MKNNSPKFKNKDGSLTRYSFACGYVEEANIQGESTCTLSVANTEIGLYNIKGTIRKEYHKPYWVQAEGLTKARQVFRKVRSILNKEGLSIEETFTRIKSLDDAAHF